ncbi:ATP-binding cassette, subfamily B [Ruegeria halocynthiae]|uniref:ATP-binding cassette, subfamily B n=1 Tax=Ruegeria halocynthiae TaxID=985054 RepID=A0A1H3EFZ7_9RHOB|nr:ABC transporter transmembrane domain-containing protein [Ruegeria halocynthiae]SDX77550.1 ATP-binding cassette, subfamily B [Ruegeria halocynthiae]
MNPLPRLATRDRIIDAVLVVSCGIVQAIALALAAFATRDAFSALHAGEALALNTVLQLAISGGVAAACLLLSRYRAEALGQSYAISLRHMLYRQIARLPKSRHEERRVGALSLRFVGDLSAARLWFGRGLPDVLSAALVLPGAVIILYFLDPALAITGIASLSGALLIMGLLAWHLGRRHQKLRHNRANIAISMIERIAIAPELDLMGRTDRELRKLDKQGASLRKDALARRGRTTSLQAVLQLGVALSGLLMLWQASQFGIAPATVAASLSVLALIALPLQNLAGAWDQYCAWSVARAKAERLLSEPKIVRTVSSQGKPLGVNVTGEFEGTPVSLDARSCSTSTLTGRYAVSIARNIAGLDTNEGIAVLYGGQEKAPKVAFVGDDHIGLQGSLRRSASLMCLKRPSDQNITEVMTSFGLTELLLADRGLDQRLAENGNGLLPCQTLRIDLVRAVLGNAEIVVIASIRWASCQHDHAKLLDTLRKLSSATIILVEEVALPDMKQSLKDV